MPGAAAGKRQRPFLTAGGPKGRRGVADTSKAGTGTAGSAACRAARIISALGNRADRYIALAGPLTRYRTGEPEK